MSDERLAQRGRMPSLAQITEAWEALGRDELRTIFPRLQCFGVGWGEPFCFRCGWFAPSRQSHSYPANWKEARAIDAAWQSASGWLERAHLHDHDAGGAADPLNLVPLCVLCHEEQPVCATAEEGIAFVNSESPHAPILWLIQLGTDGSGKNIGRPGKSQALRHMLRACRSAAIALAEGAQKHFEDEHA